MPIRVGSDLILYDVEELSKLFNVQPKSIRILLKEGRLRGRKLAKKWYVSEADLKAYFSQAEAQVKLEDEAEDEPVKSR
jgi:hypothetical protein